MEGQKIPSKNICKTDFLLYYFSGMKFQVSICKRLTWQDMHLSKKWWKLLLTLWEERTSLIPLIFIFQVW